MIQEIQNEETTVIDGYIVLIDTGEIVGLVEPKKEFRVDSAEACDWVLEKLLNCEADIASINETPAVIAARAILANAEVIKKEKQRRLEWLTLRFSAELGEYARKELEGKKQRSLKTLYGTISLRTVAERLKVNSELTAIEWAKGTDRKGLVASVESFKISNMDKEDVEKISSALRTGDAGKMFESAFALEPARESIKVITGVQS